MAAAADAPGGTPARVERFTPEGTVKQVRQANARFSAPVVALGDPRATAPFDVACPEPGTGRWADPRTWVYDFARDLPGGVACTFTLRAGVTALGGAPVTGGPFTFSTGGPAIVSATPGAEAEITEDQAFVLQLDGPVDAATVAEHASFTVEGIPERVPVTLVAGAERDAILHTFDEEWQRNTPLVVIAAPRRFPNGAAVALTWGPGIRSPGGVTSDEPQTLRWTVRPAFTAELTCERENATRGCTPLLRRCLASSRASSPARDTSCSGRARRC